MNQITKPQFISLLLIEDLFVLFCLTEKITVITAVGFSAGIILQFLLAVPIIKIYSKRKSLKDCGKIAESAILIYLIIWGGMLFSMLWNTHEIIYIPYENNGFFGKFIVAFLIGIVCVYISSSGIKALGRSALIAMVIGALCLIVVIVSALIQSDMSNLKKSGGAGFLYEFNRGFSLSGGAGSFIVVLGFTKGKPMSNAIGYFVGKIVLTITVILTGVLVSGGIMEITDFPIATSAQLSQPFPVQRIDSLFLIVFSVCAVYSIALQASMAQYLLGEIVPMIKKYKSAIVLILMATVGFLFGGNIHYSVIYSISVVVILLFAPICYFFRRNFNHG